MFEWQCAQRDVDANAAGRFKQEDPRSERELRGAGVARGVVREQGFDERSFVAKAGEQRQVDVARDARLAPSLHRNPANETRSPAVLIAETLKFDGRLKNGDHRRSFAKWRCISTNPDDWSGGWVRAA